MPWSFHINKKLYREIKIVQRHGTLYKLMKFYRGCTVLNVPTLKAPNTYRLKSVICEPNLKAPRYTVQPYTCIHLLWTSQLTLTVYKAVVPHYAGQFSHDLWILES